MKLKLKSSLIIIGTLILGIVLGMLLSGFYTHRKFDKMRQGKHFKHSLEKKLNLTEEQTEKLKPIFEANKLRFKKLMKAHFQEMDSSRKVFLNEVKPHLNPEQMKILEKMKHHRKRKHPKRKK